MKANEALELGFSFTGACAPAWDRERYEKCKKEAQEIKKTYKGADFKVVENRCRSSYGGTVIYKEIYGNTIYHKAHYFRQDQEEKYLNEGHAQRLAKLKEEYEAKVAEEMERYNERLENYKYLMSIKK